MSTKAGTIGFSARPALFTFWTVAVSVLAAAALILSAVALNLAVRSDERAALPAPRKATASGSVISGTGPGLIQVAEGAARTAALPRIYSGSAQAEAWLSSQESDRAALERGRRADAARWVAQAEAWLAAQQAEREALERGRRADAARWVAQAEAWLAQDDGKP
jgi:hypothetical protein